MVRRLSRFFAVRFMPDSPPSSICHSEWSRPAFGLRSRGISRKKEPDKKAMIVHKTGSQAAVVQKEKAPTRSRGVLS